MPTQRRKQTNTRVSHSLKSEVAGYTKEIANAKRNGWAFALFVLCCGIYAGKHIAAILYSFFS